MNASHAKRERGTSVNYTELFVFIAYFLFMLGIGLFFFMKSKNAGEKDYFLGGRNMGAWVSALSAGASDMSAWVLMGLPASIYALGMGQGFQPVASFNYQAKKIDRVKKGLLFTTAFGLVFIGAMSTISILFAEPIIAIFQKHPEVIVIGSKALRFTAIGMMFMPFSVPVNMLYQSIQQPTISSFLSLIRSGLVTIPMLLFGVPLLGLLGIQLAQPMADMIAGLISIPFILHFIRKSK